jgi:hypothetical protein
MVITKLAVLNKNTVYGIDANYHLVSLIAGVWVVLDVTISLSDLSVAPDGSLFGIDSSNLKLIKWSGSAWEVSSEIVQGLQSIIAKSATLVWGSSPIDYPNSILRWNGTAWFVVDPILATENYPGLVPATGEPVGKYLKDDMSWDTPSDCGGWVTPPKTISSDPTLYFDSECEGLQWFYLEYFESEADRELYLSHFWKGQKIEITLREGATQSYYYFLNDIELDQWDDNGTIRYYFYLKMFGGTDYSVDPESTSECYDYTIRTSCDRAPKGFPLDPTKWTISYIRSLPVDGINNPTEDIWYNLDDYISIPVGLWEVSYIAFVNAYRTGVAGVVGFQTTLSTENDAETDVGFTRAIRINSSDTDASVMTSMEVRDRSIVLDVTTDYYLNVISTENSVGRLELSAGYTDTKNLNSVTIEAVCGYL